MTSEQAHIDPARVAIYIRWSTEDQGEGTTLEVQSETCRAYLVSQGWAVNEDLIFIDDGYSGGSVDRPALSKLRKAVSTGAVDCVVLYKLDRLSRSVVDTVNLVCREWEGRCSIKSAREPIDTTSHAGRMFFYTLVNFAEWERSVIKERTYSGKLRRAHEGRNPGMRPPYGYNLGNGGIFTINESEAAIVRRIYQLYLNGMGARQILSRLNEEGSKPRYGQVWTQSTVIRILANPAYMGRLEYGRRRTLANGSRRKQGPLIVREGTMPPIIGQADWEAVQDLKKDRPGFGRGQGSGRSLGSDSLLTGLLRCRCGHGFMGKVANNKKGGHYRYYGCMGAHSKTKRFCDCGIIRQELADGIVVPALKQRFSGAGARERLVQRITAEWRQTLSEARAVLKASEKEVTRMEAGDQRLKRLLRDGKIEVAEYRELKADLDREYADLRYRVEQAQEREEQALAGLRGQSRILSLLGQVEEFDHLDLPNRKQLLRHFIKEIELYRPQNRRGVECRMHWRWLEERQGEPEEVHEVYEEQAYERPPTPARDAATGQFRKRRTSVPTIDS